MALTLDATPAGANANAYATRLQGDTYHEAHLYASDWSVPNGTKEKALVMSTRILNEQVHWNRGDLFTTTQALAWPRSGVTNDDDVLFASDVIPAWLSDATAELARHLIADDRTTQPQDEFESLEVSSELKMNFGKAKKRSVLPDSVMAIIRPYGRVGRPTVLVRT